jgi:hypothetical protein
MISAVKCSHLRQQRVFLDRSLSAGQQVMKVEMLSGGYNLNWIEPTRTGP